MNILYQLFKQKGGKIMDEKTEKKGVSDEAKTQIKELWLDVGENVAAKCYVKLVDTIEIVANDTGNIAAKLAVATMQAMQPVVMSLLDLIDGVKGDIEVEA